MDRRRDQRFLALVRSKQDPHHIPQRKTTAISNTTNTNIAANFLGKKKEELSCMIYNLEDKNFRVK